MPIGHAIIIGNPLEATSTSSVVRQSAGALSDRIPSLSPAAKQNIWRHQKQPKRPSGCAAFSISSVFKMDPSK